MDLIENYLNEFFKELQHTPGPWTEEGRAKKTKLPLFTVIKGSCSLIPRQKHNVTYPDEAVIHNSKLIARAPDMLRSLCRTYLTLLVKFPFNDRQNSTVREIHITLDGTFASLRNEISNATGLQCQYIQDTFEQYARHVEINS